MLQIKNIFKHYKTGTLVQRALDGVSLNLRESEFVCVLGPSGSGKTTLLNIIGGLDRYDSGDLVINGVSTVRYSDRDWDSYRNHTIGFVFQSYNLIPHQNILTNVELALTISGIPKAERQRRATDALERVGLGDQIHKKPNQLSGGQMQRVAIARALVNDPDILLADEPTGALDSETSLQVMELLKEVASERLVVMVTHNPELAERYATRVVTLKDGKITSDSDPYELKVDEAPVHRNLGKASMSFLTSFLLSLNNLWTKKARTFLVSFAGSIGIIGIAMILAMSNGANVYIQTVQQDSLQSYPLTITDTSFNLASMMTIDSDTGSDVGEETTSTSETRKKDVKELPIVTNFFSTVRTNDLKSLKAFINSDSCDIKDNARSIEYSYSVVPQLYLEEGKTYRRVNPDTTFESMGISSGNSLNGLFSALQSTDVFFKLPQAEELYKDSFDLKAGKWPEKYDECVVVLTSKGGVYDLVLYTLGLKDRDKLDEMVKAFSEGAETDVQSETEWFNYDEFLNRELKMLYASQYYVYDKKYKVYSDRSSDKKFVKNLLKGAETMRVVGVVQPLKDASSMTLTPGIGYHASLTDRMIEVASESDVVKAQLESKNINIFTGKKFGEENDAKKFNMSDLFSIDKNTLKKALNFDLDDLNSAGLDLSKLDLNSLGFSGLDLGDTINANDLSKLFGGISTIKAEDLFDSISFDLTSDQMSDLFSKLVNGYVAYSKKSSDTDVTKLPDAFAAFLTSSEAQTILSNHLTAILNESIEKVDFQTFFRQLAEDLIKDYAAFLQEKGITDFSDFSQLSSYLSSERANAFINSASQKVTAELEKIQLTGDQLSSIANDLVSGYDAYAKKHHYPTTSGMTNSFTKYLSTKEAKALISKTVTDAVDTSKLEQKFSSYSSSFSAQFGSAIQKLVKAMMTKVSSAITAGFSKLMSGMTASMADLFKFDSASLSKMFSMKMSADEIKDLMLSMFSTEETSLKNNLKKMGYADKDSPFSITIYPRDFKGKAAIKDTITAYNERMEKSGHEDKVINYTDTVDILMSSVTTIIDAISYVLIAFVAISLVVSSIMIGVITYISVLERKKEIGILRAIGASKRNISQVFNAETFIIGALAGLIGVGISYLLLIPTNAIISSLVPQAEIRAILPIAAAGILVVLSIVLTLIGGLIPAKKAAKADPVIALRTE